MKKILIVDDEKFIRLGLEMIIKNSFDSVELELAKNVQEALNKISEKEFDLIITDINMPGMSGIELIKNMRDSGKHTKIIVLSGFNEFEYARQCMKYGVKTYLLKPIDNEELVSSINEIFMTINEENSEEKVALLRELKYEIENREKKQRDINKILESLDISFKRYKCYYVKVKNGIESFEKKCREKNLLFIADEQNDGYLISDSEQELSEFQYDFIAESDMENELILAFEALKNLKKYGIILGKNHIKMSDIANRKYFFVNTAKVPDIYSYIKMGRFDLIEEILKDIFLQEKTKNYNYKAFEEIHQSFIRNVFDKLDKDTVNLDVLNIEFENLVFSNMKEYVEELSKVLKALAESLNKKNKIEKMYIEKAKEYIKINYSKDLNMAVVSNYVSLNYSYFSSLFKKYMNMNFLDYLNIVRIENSKEYLKKVDYKIYEISKLVGYKNPKHFSKIFKKIEKITPVEYKLKNMER